MNLMKVLTRRKAREELMDKVELAMAVVVIVGFVYKKMNPEEEEESSDTSR